MTASKVAQDGDKAFLGHPRALGYLAFSEAWERFSCGFRRDRARRSDLMPPTIPK
ncbi:hypothetical protein LRS10_16325 [Phenylobacterium sp. J426]|uniref:hypothetical protein n=1 Tax=Phenylobacterium sp. J426 TaxID=2898439 RepID=UPI0021508569|nr:hypothetical protein [Phenylobacterium sp. J426]MCR5875604.1 hypothetical protein [Phenylobacterium sp. J426]